MLLLLHPCRQTRVSLGVLLPPLHLTLFVSPSSSFLFSVLWRCFVSCVCELVPEGLLCLCRLFAGNLDTKWVPALTSPPKLLCNMMLLQRVSQCILSLSHWCPPGFSSLLAAEC